MFDFITLFYDFDMASFYLVLIITVSCVIGLYTRREIKKIAVKNNKVIATQNDNNDNMQKLLKEIEKNKIHIEELSIELEKVNRKLGVLYDKGKYISIIIDDIDTKSGNNTEVVKRIKKVLQNEKNGEPRGTN